MIDTLNKTATLLSKANEVRKADLRIALLKQCKSYLDGLEIAS